jgi:hypothetical protein
MGATAKGHGCPAGMGFDALSMPLVPSMPAIASVARRASSRIIRLISSQSGCVFGTHDRDSLQSSCERSRALAWSENSCDGLIRSGFSEKLFGIDLAIVMQTPSEFPMAAPRRIFERQRLASALRDVQNRFRGLLQVTRLLMRLHPEMPIAVDCPRECGRSRTL